MAKSLKFECELYEIANAVEDAWKMTVDRLEQAGHLTKESMHAVTSACSEVIARLFPYPIEQDAVLAMMDVGGWHDALQERFGEKEGKPECPLQ